MAWTAPKVDWVSADGVAYSDLNEIGGNLVYLKAHADATTGVHGGVSAATPSTFMTRDAAGRSKVVAPAVAGDIALLSTVTAEAVLRAAADAVLTTAVSDLGTDKVNVAGDTMTGALIGAFPNTNYTTAMCRNIKLMTTVPVLADLANGEVCMVYEV